MQTRLHTDPFTHRRLYTQTLFSHRAFDTQTSLHRNAFTHRPFYTQTLLQTDPFTHRHFYKQTLLHTDPFTHTHVFFTLLLLLLHFFLTGISKAKKRSFLNPKKRQFGGVFVFFEASRSKKHRLASPKPRHLRCCLLLVAKTTVFTVFCGRHLAKTVVFTQFSACCKNDFFHAKSPKNTVNYSVLAFDTQ